MSLPADFSYLTYPRFSHPALVHGVFSRRGGRSAGPYDSLNASFQVGDADHAVRQNREIIRRALAVPRLVSCRQVHGDKVAVIRRLPVDGEDADSCDAMITALPGVALMIQQADCQAVMLFDPARLVVGIVHSGWRGSVANIIGKTIAAMTASFDSDPAGMLAAISPSLGPCCAEFVNFRTELPEVLHGFQPAPQHFDFWAISRWQLNEAGVRPENISTASVCTSCSPDFFSYRRDRITGRSVSVIGIREQFLR